LLSASGSSGQVEGVRAYEVEVRPLSRQHAQSTVTSVMTVTPAKKLPARGLPSVAMRVTATVAVG
jgi:hypothetical protein